MVSEDSVAVEELGYEPFGKRRLSDGTPDPTDTVEGIETDRGYTGHEHLDDFGLIHMNGRIYDPRIGRFLSADPVIQSPQALQTYNRYSYAINNPLAYTDPSGYIFGIGGSIKDELKRWEQDFRHEIRRPNSLLPSLLRVGIAVGSVAGCNAWAAACAGAGEALLSGWQGADTGTAVRNGIVTAAAVYMYGEAGKYDLGTTETFFVYGGIGGVSSAATGQDIGSGFLAGGLSALVPTGSNFEVNLIIKATAGGTISELTGGKFANGATTAAFAYASTSLVSDIKNGASFGEATLDLAGKVWALPNTIIGTVVGLAGVPFGADTRFTNNAIWFENYPLGEGAVTIGNAVISSPGWGANDTRIAYGVMQNIGLHEMGHTFQYQALGPLFFPMYVASGGAFTGSSAFEQGATRYATTSKGWWPWP